MTAVPSIPSSDSTHVNHPTALNLSTADLAELLVTDVNANIAALDVSLTLALKTLEGTDPKSPLYPYAVHRVTELRGLLMAQQAWAHRFDELFFTDHVLEAAVNPADVRDETEAA